MHDESDRPLLMIVLALLGVWAIGAYLFGCPALSEMLQPVYKGISQSRQRRMQTTGAIPGSAEWMRRKSDRKQAVRINRQVLAQVANLDEEARVARRAPPPLATPQLRKQPPRERNREGLVASHAPTVSVPALAGESQSAKENTGPT